MIVWMVASGDYSDYRVEALFATKSLAVEYVAIHERHSEFSRFHKPVQMEVYGTLEFLPEGARSGLTCYHVDMDRDGQQTNVWKMHELSDDSFKWGGGTFYATCWARDKGHAVKIANERRTKSIAEGGGR